MTLQHQTIDKLRQLRLTGMAQALTEQLEKPPLDMDFDGRLSLWQWLVQMSKINVLILDDWGITAPDHEQQRDLLEILEDRYQRSSTVITSQLPVEHWHEHLNDATVADAILDRLLHNAIRVPMSGESMRKSKRALQTGSSE